MSQKLNDEAFLSIIDATPLVSIDLIIRDVTGAVLLGKRDNRPAQGYWFVPGGRIRKNETIESAFKRLCEVELCLEMNISEARCLGPYDHIYKDNFAGKTGIGTHYVALAYEISLPEGLQCQLDDQHSGQQWWPVEQLLASDVVHSNTKAYFDPAYCYARLNSSK